MHLCDFFVGCLRSRYPRLLFVGFELMKRHGLAEADKRRLPFFVHGLGDLFVRFHFFTFGNADRRLIQAPLLAQWR